LPCALSLVLFTSPIPHRPLHSFPTRRSSDLKKPGYDPVELFMDPGDRWVKLKAARALARKKTGMRYMMDVVPLDPSPIRGSHGRLPQDPDEGPVLLCSDATGARDHIRATEVRAFILQTVGVSADAIEPSAGSAASASHAAP